MIQIISKNGEDTTNEVIDWLDFYKVKWKRTNFEAILDKEWHIIIEDKLTIDFDSCNISDISAIWYRKSHRPEIKDSVKNEYSDPGLKNKIETYLRHELTYLSVTLRSLKNESPYWLNHPKNNQSDKVKALKYAKDVGLEIPPSLITNSKEKLINFFNTYTEIISKPVQGTFFYSNTELKYPMYTSVVTSEVIDRLSNTFFPSFFQKMIKKDFEIRCFYLEGEFYSMAIFSQKNSKTRVDFRNYDLENFNRWVPYKLPIELRDKLTQFMGKMDMNSGSIDLIMGLDNRYYFLEVNPVGQLGMVSKYCGYNLEQKIAEKLIYECK